MEKESAGSGVLAHKASAPVLSRAFLNVSAREASAANSDYLKMREAEGLRRAGATPAERVRWWDRRASVCQRRSVTREGFEVWR